jgi:hypothetical protein
MTTNAKERTVHGKEDLVVWDESSPSDIEMKGKWQLVDRFLVVSFGVQGRNLRSIDSMKYIYRHEQADGNTSYRSGTGRRKSPLPRVTRARVRTRQQRIPVT